MTRFNKLSGAIHFALFAGAATIMAAPVFAQDATTTEATTETKENSTELERIVVTGSRIKRAEAEGALPVTVISRVQLDLSGDISVSDYLRSTTFNSFGSFRPQSGSSAQSFAGISLRGLGSSRTLILIDGRRAPTAPNIGNSQDLNSIPLAAVERIEILTDGASAIYGSDAIGGVVNIITRKDFTGVQISVGSGYPTETGGDTQEGSIMFGVAGDRGRMLGGFSYNNRDIIFARDRDFSAGGASTFSNNFRTANAAPGTLFGFTEGGFLNNPTNGSAVPGGCTDPGFSLSADGKRCFYDFTFVSADEAQTSNQSVFLRGEFQINDDWNTYLNASVGRVQSFGRYAPVPSSPWPGGAPFIPVGSPNHPAVRFPDAGYDPTQPVFLRHRFAALGNRDTDIDSNVYDVSTGFEGTVGSVDLDIGFRRAEFQYFELGRNYVVGGLAQAAIADGSYDIYNPSANDRSLLDGLIATINRDARSVQEEVFALASFDMFEMGGGAAGLAIGGEYRRDDYRDIYDTLQSSGQIVGSAGNSAAGDRNVKAAYFEALFPFTDTLEMSLAGRLDSYSDYGSDFSPKVSVRWQLMDTLTFRGSYGEGFRAPTLDILTAQPAFSADSITDPQTCVAFGLPANCSTQITGFVIANPNLSSEQSQQWSLGAAWDATDWLNMTLDYYNITIENRVSAFSSGLIVSCLRGLDLGCPAGLSILPSDVNPPQPQLGLGAAFGPDGEVLYVQRGFANLGVIDTSGFDLNLRTKFAMGGMGELSNQLQVSYIHDFSTDNGSNQIGNPSQPKYRATLQNVWTKSDFTFAWNINYIHKTDSTQKLVIEAGGDDYGYALHLPSWTTQDVQLTWAAPWDGKLSLGVKNFTNKGPVLDPFQPTGRAFDFNLYDAYGRVPYFRYTQSF